MHHLDPGVAREKLIRILREKGITDEKVLDAFRKVHRHLFVDGAMYAQAYDDNALPIGYGQTISLPYIVALMTQLLCLGKDDKILEIGTGISDRHSLPVFPTRLYHRAFTGSWRSVDPAIARHGLFEYCLQNRRRIPRLAATCSL